MIRTASLLALGVAGIALVGCTKPPLTNGAKQFVDVETAYPITVEPQVATLVVKVDDGLQSLGRGEDQRVQAFVAQWKARGQGILNAASPSGTTNQAATASALAQIKKVLAANGVNDNSVQHTPYKPAEGDAQAPITLSFVTYVASAAGVWFELEREFGFRAAQHALAGIRLFVAAQFRRDRRRSARPDRAAHQRSGGCDAAPWLRLLK